jgi:hypothetical protein
MANQVKAWDAKLQGLSRGFSRSSYASQLPKCFQVFFTKKPSETFILSQGGDVS